MPSYVVLINYTDQGMRNVRDTVQRYESVRVIGEKLGIAVREWIWTLGPYNAIAIIEAADDATVSRFILFIGSRGNVRTVTTRAYNKDEMADILRGVPSTVG